MPTIIAAQPEGQSDEAAIVYVHAGWSVSRAAVLSGLSELDGETYAEGDLNNEELLEIALSDALAAYSVGALLAAPSDLDVLGEVILAETDLNTSGNTIAPFQRRSAMFPTGTTMHSRRGEAA